MATKPTFIEVDAKKIASEMLTEYQTITGKTVQPAHAEMLLINMFAYREALIRSAIQETAVQNLVEFATAPVLDYLSNLVGLTRKPELASECTIRFTLIGGHSGVTIPIGIRVQTEDGNVTFKTSETKTAAVGITYLDIKAKAETLGIIGNGYLANKVKIIIDPLAFVVSAGNLATTTGGANIETDAELRARIKEVPGRFSNAGPRDAYIYYAKNAHPDITDVSVTSPTGGVVNVYVAVDGSDTPTDILNAVTASCNGESVRPLTDVVNVNEPTRLHYFISVSLTLTPDAVGVDITTEINSKIEEYSKYHRSKLGKDIVRNAIVKLCMLPGVYNAVVTLYSIADLGDPDDRVSVETIAVTNTECALLYGSEIVIAGTHDE